MDVEIRQLTEDDFEQWDRALAAGFGGEVRPEDTEHWRAVVELDRSFAAFDGASIVGTGGAFSYELTVPGASVPAAGVTAVSVLPTHRRRGILSSMMRNQLDDVHDRGEPVAILWASESVIYGRFGYGLAADDLRFELARTHARFARPGEMEGSVRLIDREEAMELWPPVYDEARLLRPGMYGRSSSWWEHHSLYDPEHYRDGYSSNRYAVYELGGRPRGYVRYRFKHDWPGGLPSGKLFVGELMWTSLESYRALWEFAFGVDLVGTIEAIRRPVDEPLRWMLPDPRRLIRKPSDALWLRVIDVRAAMEARSYRMTGELVFELRDPFCSWNEGTHRLEAGPDGAACDRADSSPELTLSAADLGAAYLGGTSLDVLWQAGRIHGDREAVRRADLLLGWTPVPWCPEVF